MKKKLTHRIDCPRVSEGRGGNMKVGTTMLGSVLLLERLRSQDKRMAPDSDVKRKHTFLLPHFRAFLFADLPRCLPRRPSACSRGIHPGHRPSAPEGSLWALSLPCVHRSSSHRSLSHQDRSPVLSLRKEPSRPQMVSVKAKGLASFMSPSLNLETYSSVLLTHTHSA